METVIIHLMGFGRLVQGIGDALHPAQSPEEQNDGYDCPQIEGGVGRETEAVQCRQYHPDGEDRQKRVGQALLVQVDVIGFPLQGDEVFPRSRAFFPSRWR